MMSARVALAQDDSSARSSAQALFDEAVRALDAGDTALACPKLEEVARLLPGKAGALDTLARCHERAGRLASAWARYRQALDASRSSTSTRDLERERRIADAITALEPRLARLTVDVPQDDRVAPGLEIARDGAAVGLGAMAQALPVDAGRHVFRIQATGRPPRDVTIDVADGQLLRVDLSLAPPPPQTEPPSLPATKPPRSARDASEPIWPWIVGIGGAGALVGSAAFVGWWADANHRFGVACPSENAAGAPVCVSDLEVVDAIDAERTRAAGFAIALGVVGSAAVVVAVVGAAGGGGRGEARLVVGPDGASVRGAW